MSQTVHCDVLEHTALHPSSAIKISWTLGTEQTQYCKPNSPLWWLWKQTPLQLFPTSELSQNSLRNTKQSLLWFGKWHLCNFVHPSGLLGLWVHNKVPILWTEQSVVLTLETHVLVFVFGQVTVVEVCGAHSFLQSHRAECCPSLLLQHTEPKQKQHSEMIQCPSFLLQHTEPKQKHSEMIQCPPLLLQHTEPKQKRHSEMIQCHSCVCGSRRTADKWVQTQSDR